MSSAPLTSFDFRRALGHFATGVTVVTVETAPRRVHGMTANSFTSVSLEPPLISVCVDQHAHLLPLVKEKRVFGINVLKEDQQKLSEFFSRAEQPESEEASLNICFRWTQEKIPLLENVLCQVACRLNATHIAGDHTIVIGEVLYASLFTGHPLLFFRGEYARFKS
ncbi:MAG TPA: flavin reductase family protein [Candidatus Acidoferrum sp.]|jgi:flavin reductase (DIM6/NTAB) family NADH-FMN oxidoreductase RutF